MRPALHRHSRSSLLVLPLLLAVLPAGCADSGIGRKCANPTDAGVSGTQLYSPSLECQSRLCLLREPTGTDPAHTTCTDFCDDDKQCAKAVVGDPLTPCTSNSECPSNVCTNGLCGTPGLCTTSFVCAVAVETGPFCCKKMCICRTDLVPGDNQDPVDGGTILPASCFPGKSSCRNVTNGT